jgi:hypothetical protein
MEVEPNDPAQQSVYSNPKGYYYPRGQEELNNGPPVPHCPRAVMLRNATSKLIYRSAGNYWIWCNEECTRDFTLSIFFNPRCTGGASELYDLTADPRELTNLYGLPESAAMQAELSAALLEWYVDTADVTPLTEDDRGLPPSPPNPPFPWPPKLTR